MSEKALIPVSGEAAMPAAVRPEVVDTVVDEVVREINAIHGRASLDAALSIGRLIVDRFYHGDLSVWRSRKNKEVSFRRLAARANTDLCVSATSLYRAVALYDLDRRIGIANLKLTMTQLRVVLGLPEERQVELLTAADNQKWSSDRIEREAVKVRSTMGSRTGRPPSPPLFRAFRKLTHSWKEVEEVFDGEGPANLSSEQAKRLYMAIDDLRNRIERIGRRICGRDADPQAAGYAGPPGARRRS